MLRQTTNLHKTVDKSGANAGFLISNKAGAAVKNHQYPLCGAAGYQPSSVIQDMYSVYRQGAVQRPPPPPPPPLPPAMPLHAPVPPQPAHSSHAGSDYGSLDRSSVSESDALSPVKRSQVSSAINAQVQHAALTLHCSGAQYCRTYVSVEPVLGRWFHYICWYGKVACCHNIATAGAST